MSIKLVLIIVVSSIADSHCQLKCTKQSKQTTCFNSGLDTTITIVTNKELVNQRDLSVKYRIQMIDPDFGDITSNSVVNHDIHHIYGRLTPASSHPLELKPGFGLIIDDCAALDLQDKPMLVGKNCSDLLTIRRGDQELTVNLV